jgi:hypothetical protein
MVPILRPWSWAKAIRSSSRAIVPSSRMISQITPDGLRPASRATSTAASVWPARTSTPPSRATSGKTWPGETICSGPLAASIATAMVRARSAAEMPVVTPSRASIETVKAVSWRVPLVWPSARAELLDPLLGQRQADQAAAVLGHEVDRVGRRHLRGDDEVALILAVLVVDQDEHPAVARLVDDRLGAAFTSEKVMRQASFSSALMIFRAPTVSERNARAYRPQG